MASSRPAPGKSFADVHPELLDEWDYDANLEAGRTPQTTTPRSSFKAAWVCRSCGNKWKMTPNARSAQGSGCPICAHKRGGKIRQKPPLGKSLADVNPLVAASWHPDLNGDTTPFDVFPRSEVDRWWKCSQGHEEKTSPKQRLRIVSPDGCSTCGGRRVRAGFNDLATTHPHIAAQWDADSNKQTGFDPTMVSAGSERSFWWTCPVGHRMNSAVKVRVRNAGCAQCSVITSSRVEIELRCEFQAVGIPVDMNTRRWAIGAKTFQLDICAPDWKLIIEFDGWRWHEQGFEQDLRKTRFLKAHGWTVIRIRDRLKPISDCDVVVDSTADSVPGMVKKVLYRLQTLNLSTPHFASYLAGNHLWAEKEANRRTEAERSRSLRGEYPDIARELDEKENNGLRPENLHPGSSRLVTWRCSTCDHKWVTTVAARTGSKNAKGTGCPKCAVVRRSTLMSIAQPGQSLAELFPDVAAQWDTKKNTRNPDSYYPYSTASVWWICPTKGHSYRCRISSKTTQGSGCSICAGKQVVAGDNDLATTHPELLVLWDYEKNSSIGLYPHRIMAGSDKRAHWLCATCSSSRETKIYSVKHGNHNCWECEVKARSRRKKKAPKERSLAFLRPDLLKEWDKKRNAKQGLFPDEVFAQSHTRAIWTCATCSHTWEATVQNRFLGTGCPQCRSSRNKK